MPVDLFSSRVWVGNAFVPVDLFRRILVLILARRDSNDRKSDTPSTIMIDVVLK